MQLVRRKALFVFVNTDGQVRSVIRVADELCKCDDMDDRPSYYRL